MSTPLTSEQKQTWLWLGVLVLFIVLLILTGPVLAPFLAAAILAYMLNPAVDWLSTARARRYRLPRAAAAMLVIFLLCAILLGIVLVVVPVLQKEFIQLRDQLPGLLTRIDTFLRPKLASFGVDVNLDSAGIQKILTEQLTTSGEQVWTTVLASARIGGSALLGWLATLGLIPFVLFYLLVDWHLVLARFAENVPRRWVGKMMELAREMDALLAQYLRGQLAVMISLTMYYCVALALVRLEVALPVGILTGLLSFVPYLGFGLGIVLALLAAVLQYDSLQGILLVCAVYGIGQVIESFFLTPRLVGERIGLHPLIVIFALLAFGQLFGFVGILLALPASAALSVAFRHLRRAYLASPFYNQR